MSEARERLLAQAWATSGALNAFLSRPDDLLAILVEAHGVESIYNELDATYGRTEGDRNG